MESSGPPHRPSVLPCSKCPDLQGPSDPATASHRIPLTKFAMPVLASHSETVAGRINRSDPFELLVLGPMVLRNGRRIIADSTHPTSSRPLSPPENDSRPLIRPLCMRDMLRKATFSGGFSKSWRAVVFHAS